MSVAHDDRALPPIRLVRDETDIDVRSAEEGVAQLLRALGHDQTSASLRDTPRRIVQAYTELLRPQPFSLTTFPNDEAYDELVLARDIPFVSVCEHHLLPFSGVAHVGYVPGARILGLSKLARVVDFFARRLQLQERLTKQVASCLTDHLRPRGVGVVLVGRHACMAHRGARAAGSTTVTSAMHGVLRDDARSRAEFMALSRTD